MKIYFFLISFKSRGFMLMLKTINLNEHEIGEKKNRTKSELG